MNTTKLAASLVGGLAAVAILAGLAAPASADSADAKFLNGLSHLRDTGFDARKYDPGKLIAIGHQVCSSFDQGMDSAAVSDAVAKTLKKWNVRYPGYNATWIVKGATAAYCPTHNAKTGPI